MKNHRAYLEAAVSGLLLSPAKGSFNTLNSGILQSNAKMIDPDQTLPPEGPETATAGEQLREVITRGMMMV